MNCYCSLESSSSVRYGAADVLLSLLRRLVLRFCVINWQLINSSLLQLPAFHRSSQVRRLRARLLLVSVLGHATPALPSCNIQQTRVPCRARREVMTPALTVLQ